VRKKKIFFRTKDETVNKKCHEFRATLESNYFYRLLSIKNACRVPKKSKFALKIARLEKLRAKLIYANFVCSKFWRAILRAKSIKSFALKIAPQNLEQFCSDHLNDLFYNQYIKI
jgi:hypothetical protein